MIVPRASTHLDFTDTPPILPASVLGQAMASYYVQAWLGEYLQHASWAGAALMSGSIRYLMPEPGDARQMATFDRNDHLSFYFCSGLAFRPGNGRWVRNGDLDGDGCPA